MNKIQFEKIIKNYTIVADDCETFVKLFENGQSIEDLTIKAFKELQIKARNLQSKSDSILHNELYHLIGMGNLTPIQTQKLCAVIKKIASARSYFKPIATYVLNKLPEVPDKSSYKCEVAEIKLNSVFEE